MAAAGLSDESIEEFREAFTLFDRNQDGTVNSKDLGNVLKAIGQNPSDEETRQLVQRVSSKYSEKFYTFKLFFNLFYSINLPTLLKCN